METKHICHKIVHILPKELIRVIQGFIPNLFLIFTNTFYYNNYHYLLKETILYNKYDKYIRYIVKNDFDFILNKILNENNNNKIWLSTKKKYTNKNIIYNNFFYFLIDYCIEKESIKCKNILNNYLKEQRLCQNRHKKNKYLHIRWKT